MVFDINRFVRQTEAMNAGQITTSFNPSVTPALSNGPGMFSYASAVDNIAAIGAANYFSDVCYSLSVNDLIFAVGSDAAAYYLVAAVNRDAGTITVASAFPSGVIGTANINNLAVTTAKLDNLAVTSGKIAANAVGSAQLAGTALQYIAVPITAAAFNGMYAAPVQLVAAGGANTIHVLDEMRLLMTYNSVAYAAGGVAAVQYAATVNGAGVIASTTLAAATFQATASNSFAFNSGVVSAPFATCVNQGLYLSNITGAFTTGNSAMVAHVWFRTVPTV